MVEQGSTKNPEQVIKEKLTDFKKRMGSLFAPAKEDKTAEHYLETPEALDPSISKPPERETAKGDLKKLAKVISEQPTTGEARANFISDIKREVQVATANIMTTSTNASTADFYTQIQLLTDKVDETNLLPMARYVARSADSVGTGPNEGARKVRIAFEIFAGEQDLNSTRLAILTNIIKDARESYGLPADYVNTELREMMQKYNTIDPHRAAEIENAAKGMSHEDILTEEEIRNRLRKEKNGILEIKTGNDALNGTLRAKMDLMLLSLPPYKIRQLLGTIPESLKYKHSRNIWSLDPLELRNDLSKPDNQVGFDELFARWKQMFEATLDKEDINHHTERDAMAGYDYSAVKEYLLNMRNEYFVVFMRSYAPTLTQSGDDFRTWMNTMSDEYNPEKPHHQHDLMITVLAMQSQNDFLFSEYFKGKMAEFITDKHHPEEWREFIDRAKNQTSFALHNEDFFHHIMREVNQANLYKIGNNYRGRAYDIVESNVKNMKTLSTIKAQTTIGDVAINVRYGQKRERMDMGFEFTQTEVRSEGSLAYATATYMSRTKELQEVSSHVGEFVKQVEKGGKPEDLVTAAGKIDNKTMDTLGEIPIVKLAAQSYIRLIRDKIQFSNGQLPPDMFSNRDYIKNVLDKELEFHVKSVYDPDMTDEEKETYLRLGKALAFTSGEFQDILSDALPPMTAIVDWDLCPQEVKRKLERGENLTMAEMRSLHLSVKPEYRDFPFRSLLITMNPLKWLFAWIKNDDYGMFQSGFIPHKAGGSAMDWVDAMDASEAVQRSLYFGLVEEAVPYFDGRHAIPVLKLSDYTHNVSLEKRGGVRAITVDVVRRHVQELHIRGTLNGVDGVKTMEKLMVYSPMLAYRFLKSPPTDVHLKIQWTVPGPNGQLRVLKESDPKDAAEISRLKAEQLDKLFTYMQEHYPTFFIGVEKNHFFRQSELSFVQNIRESVLTDLDHSQPGQPSYWMMLNNEEQRASGRLMQGHDATQFGPNNEHRLMVSKDIVERMTSILREAELYLQEERINHPGASHTKLSDFFRSTDPATLDPKLYEKLVTKIINQRKGWHDLDATNVQLFALVRRFANESFFNQDSIYASKRYLGNIPLPPNLSKKLQEKGYAALSRADQLKIDSYKMPLSAYYQKILGQGVMSNPFNWAYLNQAEFNFQGTGVGMVGRNMGDLKPILDSNSFYLGLNGKINDAISQPGEAAKIMEGAFDDLGNKLNEVKNSHGGALSAEMGWVMAAYAMTPFNAGHARDIPGAGMFVARVINSWASHMNKKDRFKALVFDAKTKKHIMDKWLKFTMTKHLFSPHQDNIQVETGLAKSIEIDIPLFGKMEIPLSRTMRKLFGGKEKPVFGPDQVQYTVDAFKHFIGVEDYWVGGDKNFGVGYLVMLTFFLIGIGTFIAQAARESMKSLESAKT